jgi:hypothetical protein
MIAPIQHGKDFLKGFLVALTLSLIGVVAAWVINALLPDPELRPNGNAMQRVSGSSASKAGAISIVVTGPDLEIRQQCRDVCDDLSWDGGGREVQFRKLTIPGGPQ